MKAIDVMLPSHPISVANCLSAAGSLAHDWRVINLKAGRTLCLIGIVLLLAGRAEGQGRFRVTHNAGVRHDSSVRIEGQVVNDGDRDAFDVWVTAEALDARGKVVARGITFASPLLAGRRSVPFVAKVPFVDGVETFRVAVTSYRDAGVVQSP